MDRTTFDNYLATYNTGDLDAVAEYYADDIIFENFGGHHEGSDVLEFLKGLHQAVSDTMTPRLIMVDGDDIAMEADTEVLAHMDLPDLPIGAMVKDQRVIARTFIFYKTQGDKIKHIRIAGWPPESADQ